MSVYEGHDFVKLASFCHATITERQLGLSQSHQLQELFFSPTAPGLASLPWRLETSLDTLTANVIEEQQLDARASFAMVAVSSTDTGVSTPLTVRTSEFKASSLLEHLESVEQSAGVDDGYLLKEIVIKVVLA